MLIAGEASGDLHGANLVLAMKRIMPDLSFFGIGGMAMENAGVSLITSYKRLSVVGITEVFYRLPDLLAGYWAARKAIRERKPDLLILIDFPDFNLKVAGFAKKCKVPVLYYISPQVWAWRTGRVKEIARLVDHMAVILPFEADFYRKHSVPVTYVGHPLLDVPGLKAEKPQKKSRGHSVIGLLPGSRDKEIVRHLNIMLKASELISKKIQDSRFLLSVAPSVTGSLVERRLEKCGLGVECRYTGSREVFAESDLCIIVSGTASLEAAIAGVPAVVIYRVSRTSYMLGKMLVKVPFISLPNLIAGDEIYPELVQEDATPENIAGNVCGILLDGQRLDKMMNALEGLRKILGTGGASARTAELAAGLLSGSAR